jgi:lantibiotic modifying enzyme
MGVFSMGEEYGWIKVIENLSCNSIEEIVFFYQKAGALLAIADTLNYTDGHCENVIAQGMYPILLDGETFFQNYASEVLQHKNVLTTSLIQKITDDQTSSSSLYSAFQSPMINKSELLYTHAENERTDDIKVGFQGLTKDKHHHLPHYSNSYFTGFDFPEKVLQGYCLAFDHITKSSNAILKDLNWWETMARVRSRLIIRETAAYLCLIRLIQQPKNCKTRATAFHAVAEKISASPFFEYESEDLLKSNIPYFYHRPGECHLYDGNHNLYKNIFCKSGMDIIKRQIINRDDCIKKVNSEIISKHLKRK